MADHWRYQDRVAAGQLLTKRPIAELDDVLLHGAAGYGRGELRFDERDARMLDYGKTGAAYAPGGLTGADVSGLGDGSILGASLTGSLRVPSLGLSGLEDPRFSGAPSSLLKGVSGGLNGGRSDILARQDVQGGQPGFRPLPPDAGPTLFVEGLPRDCMRREASHIFRPFRGYKEVRFSVKKTLYSGGEKIVLCFVEFEDAFSAAKALNALQGYRLDESDRESEPLRLQFARLGTPRVGKPCKRRQKKIA